MIPISSNLPQTTPEKLEKDVNPPSLLVLGLKPIKEYDYLKHATIQKNLKASLPLIHYNIQRIQQDPDHYHYLDQTNPLDQYRIPSRKIDRLSD